MKIATEELVRGICDEELRWDREAPESIAEARFRLRTSREQLRRGADRSLWRSRRDAAKEALRGMDAERQYPGEF